MKDNCNCDQPDCNHGHYPVQVSEDGDVDWVGCPKCVINNKHLCDQESTNLKKNNKYESKNW